MVRGWVVAKVGADISNPDPAVRRQVGAEPVRRLVQHLDLLQAELGVTTCYCFPELVRQGVEHGVVRVHGGKPVLLQLIRNNVHNLLHPSAVICPVTDNLQTMGEVAICIWEVWLQLKGSSVALDCLGDVAGVLVHRRQVAVCVCKGWIDLDSSCVALKGSLYIVHLFQSVSHVAVSICKGRLDPYCLLVMEQSLIQLALLLQDRCEVAVSCGKLWEHLQGL